MKEFYFDTGVRVNNFSPPVPVMPGNIVRNGILLIPFSCEGVPANANFMFACDNPNLPEAQYPNIKVVPIERSNLVSKFAYFKT